MIPGSTFRRAAWTIPAFFLNVLFLGTSHLLAHFPYSYWLLYVSVVIHIQLFFHLSIQQYYDYASMILTVMLLALAYVGFNRRGQFRALLKSAQILSATFIPLGLEILAFDNPEWGIHVTQFQADLNIIPWFTNADLFATAVSIFTATLFLELGKGVPKLDQIRSRLLLTYCRRLVRTRKALGGRDAN